MQRSIRLASVIILLAFLMAITPVGAASLSSWKQKLAETARSIAHIQSILRIKKQQQRDAANQLAVSERKLDVTRANLRDVRSQLRDTRYRLAVTQSELEQIEKRLNERNDLLAVRLVDTYKHGNLSYASVLLGSADFWDLVSKSYVIKKILQSDVILIEAIKEDKKAVEEHKATLEVQERKRASLEYKQTTLTRSVYTQTVKHQKTLKQVTSERTKYEQMLAALEASSKSIAAMVRQMQKTPAGRKRLGQVWRGSFMMPVPGQITSPFGMRYHPILHSRRMHTGTDIAAPSGTTIKSAAGGYVAFSGYYDRAYGNTVIIDHGGGVITFYGHCSSLLVKKGTTVKQGQAIARVGSTGLSTGPHVHFEVQKNGVPVPPF